MTYRFGFVLTNLFVFQKEIIAKGILHKEKIICQQQSTGLLITCVYKQLRRSFFLAHGHDFRDYCFGTDWNRPCRNRAIQEMNEIPWPQCHIKDNTKISSYIYYSQFNILFSIPSCKTFLLSYPVLEIICYSYFVYSNVYRNVEKDVP